MNRQANFSLTLAHPDYLGILGRHRPPGQLRILVCYLRPLGVAGSVWPPAPHGLVPWAWPASLSQLPERESRTRSSEAGSYLFALFQLILYAQKLLQSSLQALHDLPRQDRRVGQVCQSPPGSLFTENESESSQKPSI